MGYLDSLIDDCKVAMDAIPVQEIVVRDLSELDDIERAIYIFEQVNGSPEVTFLAMSQYKSLKERSCPKLNLPSRFLYVGSTTTGVRKRIEQHIGLGHKSTYALHLKYWFAGEYKLTVMQYNVSDRVLQLIEDDISDRLKPAFGKMGGNNK
ncbi:GIY-YIG nuclease family protein [Chitinilyticum piscinae]|uniref:GIY-YIG nuclease family protein n=1 Tax=Chitinilyticum piscinae TaxID=2866724 RepID=A0A8J7FPM4_9NEIS|nr:GIY-YIG nuclease family protein [Chitinilyticum piscinae]MBE9610861.1 GIY-YIG nuclease family protein [Chitinilyticum piscinae]